MPKSHSHKRNGADAAFARAVARAEFGRFYCDENDLREVRRSMARRRHEDEAGQPAANGSLKPGKPKAPTLKGAARNAPRLRERRTELAEAFQRLREAGKQRR